MLGTPNAGTVLADDANYLDYGFFQPSWAATKDLRTNYVRNVFNRAYPWPKSVELDLIAGSGVSSTSALSLKTGSNVIKTRNDFPSERVNDGAVPRPSVSGIYYGFKDLRAVRWQSFTATPHLDRMDVDPTDTFWTSASQQDHFSMLDDATIHSNVVKLLRGGSMLRAETRNERKADAAAVVLAGAVGEDMPLPLLERTGQTLFSGTIAEIQVAADASTTLKFQLFASDSATAFRLKSPTGEVVDSNTPQSNANVQYSVIVGDNNSALMTYEIASPTRGDWTIVLDGSLIVASQSKCNLMVFGDSNVALLPQTAALFNQGQDVVVTCALADFTGDPAGPVLDGTIKAEVRFPDQSTTQLNLFDDGLHNDGTPNDGVYAAVLPGVPQAGEYSITYRATAQNSAGQALQRVGTGAFSVSSENGNLWGDPVFAAVDTDGDDVPDFFQAKCLVNLNVAGDYILSGELVNADGALRVAGSGQFHAGISGPMTVSLFFDLATIRAANVSGEFHIENLQLFEVTSSSVAWLDTYRGTSTIQVPRAANVTAQPQDQLVIEGGQAIFSVTADGTGSLSYQWQRKADGSASWSDLTNGGSYSGVTTQALTVIATGAMSGDQFRCVVANGVIPNATSVAARLTVPADSDGDAIDDAWEMHYFGNLTTVGLGTDFDHDGFLDSEEFYRSFDPTMTSQSNYQPDAQIGPGVGYMIGNGIYDRNATTQVLSTRVARSKSKTCLIFVQNDGQFMDTIRVQADPIGGKFTVRYFRGKVEVTARVRAGTLKLRNIAPGKKQIVKAFIHVRGTASVGEQGSVTFHLTSATDPAAQDAVRFEVTAR